MSLEQPYQGGADGSPANVCSTPHETLDSTIGDEDDSVHLLSINPEVMEDKTPSTMSPSTEGGTERQQRIFDSSDFQRSVLQTDVQSRSANSSRGTADLNEEQEQSEQVSGRLNRSHSAGTVQPQETQEAALRRASRDSDNLTDDSRSLAILAAEAAREINYVPTPTSRHFFLYSKLPLKRRYHYAALLALISSAFTFFSIYYAYNAGIAPDPLQHLLWNSPPHTVFTINILTQISTILLAELTNTVSEALRWSKASNTRGISFLSFLSLSNAISPFGLLSLIFPWSWKPRGWIICYRWLAIQRFTMFVLRSFLVFVLLLDASFQENCVSALTENFPIPGGVLPFETSFFDQVDLSLRLQTVFTFGALHNCSRSNQQTIVQSNDSECPQGRSGWCSSTYLLQKLHFAAADLAARNWTSNNTGFLKLFHAPLYDVVFEFPEKQPVGQVCRRYGNERTAMRLDICVGTSDLHEMSIEFTFPCVPNKFRFPGDNCDVADNWNPSPIIRMSVWKRYADISYLIPGFTFDKITNITPRVKSQSVPSHVYLKLYDKLFGEAEKNEMQAVLLYYVATELSYESVYINETGIHVDETRIVMYMLPWLLQKIIEPEPRNLPAENSLNANLCQSVIRVQLALKSFYTYSVFSLFTLAWCLVRLCQCILNRSPCSSMFPDFDLLHHFSTDQRLIIHSSDSLTVDSIQRRFNGSNVYIQSNNDLNENGEIAMTNIRVQ